VNPTTVRASLADETAKATENAKADAETKLTTSTSAVNPTTVRASLAEETVKATENAKADAERNLFVRASDIDRVDINPTTANMTINRMAQGVPNNLDKNGNPLMAANGHLDDSHLTGADPPYGSRLRTTVVSAFSHSFGNDSMDMMRLKQMIVEYVTDKFNAVRSPPTAANPKQGTYDDEAGSVDPNRNKLESAYDAVVESKAFKLTTEILGNIGDVMDVLGIVMLFTDAFYMREEFLTYGQDTSKGYQPRLLTAGAIEDAIAKTVDAQVRSIEEYNCMLKKLNEADPPPYQAYTYATYPQISGPLDYLDRELPRKTSYDTQARVVAEINAVREALLKNTNTVHGALMRDRLGQYAYDSIQTGQNKLWMYVGGIYGQFTGIEADALYREAFTHVCKYNGGIVYEDTHLGQDITKAVDPNMEGRARFQCGWATKNECIRRSNDWIRNKGQQGGNYAEWYTWDELKGFKENPTVPPQRSCNDAYGQIYPDEYDYSAQKESKIPAANLTKLQASNSAGACVVASAGIRQMCEQARGNYDPATHTCSFTPEFCQAIGTCYNNATRTCYMPTKDLKILNIFFGDGLPREYIRQNGCNYENSIDPSNIMDSEISGANGQKWSDNARKDPNLNENFKKLLSSPAYAAGFATSVVGAGQFAASMSTQGSAVLSRTALTFGTRTVSVGGVLTTAPRTLTVGGALAAAQILAIASCILAEFMKGWEVINKQPSDEIGEYTVGGWESDGETPKTLAFTPGWVTKPLPLHAPTDRTLTPLGDFDHNIASIPGSFKCNFFADQNALAAAGGVAGNRQLLSGGSLETAVRTYTSLNSAKDAVPKVQCRNRCATSQGSRVYGYSGDPTKGILAASQPDADRIFCLPPFPGDMYFDPAIGPSATVLDPGSYTNNTWTNGEQASWPQYPFGPSTDYTQGAWHQPPDQYDTIKQWKYQLVYDKQRFGNADSNVYGTPDHLWNTTLLRKYFRDSRISEIRRYYCQAAMNNYIKDKTKIIHEKCFGYLSFELNNFTFLPMTVLARVGRYTPAV
jgi:hypothetical protein